MLDGKRNEMSASDYNRYKAAIEYADQNRDREAMESIYRDIIANYGIDNDDFRYLDRTYNRSFSILS